MHQKPNLLWHWLCTSISGTDSSAALIPQQHLPCFLCRHEESIMSIRCTDIAWRARYLLPCAGITWTHLLLPWHWRPIEVCSHQAEHHFPGWHAGCQAQSLQKLLAHHEHHLPFHWLPIAVSASTSRISFAVGLARLASNRSPCSH